MPAFFSLFIKKTLWQNWSIYFCYITKLKKESAKLSAKFLTLILDILKDNPYEGLGQPEALKHDLSGWWSRRINQEHRLVYKIEEDKLIIGSCYGHYND